MTTGNALDAYDRAERVTSYDADMDVMHPNRHAMVAAALDLLPFGRNEEFAVLELGIGTGFFTARLLERFPRARVVAVDGAPAMADLVEERLGPASSRVDLRIGDFRGLQDILATGETGEAVITSYALHHLDGAEKAEVLSRCATFLEPGGWLLNADLIVADSPALEARIQELRVEGILQRAPAGDPRFTDAGAVRRYLDRLEAEDGDEPLTLQRDLELLAGSGLSCHGVFWLDGREALTGGIR